MLAKPISLCLDIGDTDAETLVQCRCVQSRQRILRRPLQSGSCPNSPSDLIHSLCRGVSAVPSSLRCPRLVCTLSLAPIRLETVILILTTNGVWGLGFGVWGLGFG